MIIQKYKLKSKYLNEIAIEIGDINPVELYGVNENKLSIIKDYFPKLKIVARGGVVKAIGEEEEIKSFENKLALLIAHLIKYKSEVAKM